MSTEIKSIEGGGTPDKMRDEVRRLKASLDYILEAQATFAQITRSKYDALIEQGFTPVQALELCK